MGDVIASTYEIIQKIGSGGGANVYLANHLRLGKLVVLKADKRKVTTKPELLRREVDILKNLSQEYIPQVYDYFAENDLVYTVIDYVDGESLDKPLKRGERFSQVQVIKWAKQILAALCYLHSPTHGTPPKGYVHGDIKPANIMLRSSGDICLIDFNIALALGEENTVGVSPGYASPEHFGLDFSSGSYNYDGLNTVRSSIFGRSSTTRGRNVTGGLTAKSETAPDSMAVSSVSRYKKVVPDARSDIYSLGATLYHLLSGEKPEQDAMKVVPLSDKEFSPQIIGIIAKAMNPNPELRFQTADEMLQAFEHLHENDPRTRRMNRQNKIAVACIGVLLAAGIGVSYIGLRQMEGLQRNYALAEYSANALDAGNAEEAEALARQALPEERGILDPEYTSQAVLALTNALGAYDLSDGYKAYKTLELPAEPFYLELAPDGNTAACIYAYNLAIFDTATCEILYTLPVEASALSEVHYLDDATVVFSGRDGIQLFDIQKGTVLWTGRPATQIAVSADGSHIVGVNKDETFATVYSANDGTAEATVDFAGKHQYAAANDVLYNPDRNLLAMNGDGTAVAVSFSDGSVQLFDLTDPSQNWLLMEPSDTFTKFHGGFYQDCFAFSASGDIQSCFKLANIRTRRTSDDTKDTGKYYAMVDKTGIYISFANYLVQNDPISGAQTPLVTTGQAIQSFATNSGNTVIATDESYMFYDDQATLISQLGKEAGVDLLDICGNTALIANVNSTSVRVMRFTDHSEATILSYDRDYIHDEARVNADGESVILYSYNRFRIYAADGRMIAEREIPNASEVFSQQLMWYGETSVLKVLYNDGSVLLYDAATGAERGSSHEEPPEQTRLEQYETDAFLVVSPLHGAPEVHEKGSDETLLTLSEDAGLARVVQAGDYIVVQYVTAAGYKYGKLYDAAWNELAELPYLCDVVGTTLYFDCPSGDIRKTEIFSLEELIDFNNFKEELS